MTHPYDKKQREILAEHLKLPNIDPLTDPIALPMGEAVGFISQLALYHCKTRGIDPIKHEEEGYVGDFAFQPPHTYMAVHRGLGDPEMHPDLRTRPEHQENRCTRSTVSSGGWTNDDYHRDTDVQRVSDGRMFMFDDDAGQPDEHFCQGPLSPEKLPSVVLATPPQAFAEEAHSAPIASFPGELGGPTSTPANQVTVDPSLKASIKGDLQENVGPAQAKSLLRPKFYKNIKAKCLGALSKLLCAGNATQQTV